MATIIVALSYIGLALYLTIGLATYVHIAGFGVALFVLTSAYVVVLVRAYTKERLKVAIRISGVATMLVFYFAIWEYWGSGDGPWAPAHGLFGSRINLGCNGFGGGCFFLNSWLIFCALVLASVLILWPLRKSTALRQPV